MRHLVRVLDEGGGMDHASPLATLTADAIGQESLAPCLSPHWKRAWMSPRAVMIVTLLFDMLSAAHSTNPVSGQASRRRHAHWYSRVMRS